MGGAGERGAGAGAVGRHAYRRVRGDQRQRLRALTAPRRGVLAPGAALRHRLCAQHRVRPHRVRARPARPGTLRGHGMLVVAGRVPPRVPEPARRRMPGRAGRGRQPDPRPGRLHPGLQGPDALAGRALQDLRRLRGRLRAGRGLRCRGPQAARRRAGGRRPHPRGRARHRDQPGRAQRRPHRPQRRGPGGCGPAGARGCGTDPRSGELRRGAWDRHLAGRPHRGAGPRRLAWQSPQPRPAAAPRRGEGQHRSPRGGGRHRGRDQAGARPAASRDSAPAARDPVEPLHSVGPTQRRRAHTAHARGRRAADRGSPA